MLVAVWYYYYITKLTSCVIVGVHRSAWPCLAAYSFFLCKSMLGCLVQLLLMIYEAKIV